MIPIRKEIADAQNFKDNELDSLYSAELVDAEVHIGTGLFGPTGNMTIHADIGIYRKQLKKWNIKHAVALSVPTYELELRNGDVERACIWERDADGKIVYKKVTLHAGMKLETVNPKGPFIHTNAQTLEVVEKENKRQGRRLFYFAPLLHPKLDSQTDIEDFLNNKLTVAIKVHGIGTHSGPSDVPAWAIRLSRKYDTPFFVHTDFSTRQEKAVIGELAVARMLNIAHYWARWALDNNTSIYLAHGAVLDPKAIALINKADNIVTGTGPDAVINAEEARRATKEGDYLHTLLSMVDSEKILFSSDFAWNMKNFGWPADLDWGSKRRVIEAAISQGFSRKEIEGVLSTNAIRFFGL